MQRMIAFVTHQRKTARQHAAIGQRGQQLSAMADAGLLSLQQGQKRAAGAFAKPQRSLMIARDRLPLCLCIGELRCRQPDRKARIAVTAVTQQRSCNEPYVRRMP